MALIQMKKIWQMRWGYGMIFKIVYPEYYVYTHGITQKVNMYTYVSNHNDP